MSEYNYQYPYGPPRGSEPTPKQTYKALLIAAIIAVVGLIALSVYVVTKKDSDDPAQQKDGYYKASDIEPDLLMNTNDKIDADPDADYVATNVTCVDTAKREYRCLITFDDSDTITVIVNVASDYQTWVSHGER